MSSWVEEFFPVPQKKYPVKKRAKTEIVVHVASHQPIFGVNLFPLFEIPNCVDGIKLAHGMLAVCHGAFFGVMNVKLSFADYDSVFGTEQVEFPQIHVGITDVNVVPKGVEQPEISSGNVFSKLLEGAEPIFTRLVWCPYRLDEKVTIIATLSSHFKCVLYSVSNMLEVMPMLEVNKIYSQLDPNSDGFIFSMEWYYFNDTCCLIVGGSTGKVSFLKLTLNSEGNNVELITSIEIFKCGISSICVLDQFNIVIGGKNGSLALLSVGSNFNLSIKWSELSKSIISVSMIKSIIKKDLFLVSRGNSVTLYSMVSNSRLSLAKLPSMITGIECINNLILMVSVDGTAKFYELLENNLIESQHQVKALCSEQNRVGHSGIAVDDVSGLIAVVQSSENVDCYRKRGHKPETLASVRLHSLNTTFKDYISSHLKINSNWSLCWAVYKFMNSSNVISEAWENIVAKMTIFFNLSLNMVDVLTYPVRTTISEVLLLSQTVSSVITSVGRNMYEDETYSCEKIIPKVSFESFISELKNLLVMLHLINILPSLSGDEAKDAADWLCRFCLSPLFISNEFLLHFSKVDQLVHFFEKNRVPYILRLAEKVFSEQSDNSRLNWVQRAFKGEFSPYDFTIDLKCTCSSVLFECYHFVRDMSRWKLIENNLLDRCSLCKCYASVSDVCPVCFSTMIR